MAVDTRQLVLVQIGDADSAIAELPGIGILVLFGSDDLRRDVLLELNDSTPPSAGYQPIASTASSG